MRVVDLLQKNQIFLNFAARNQLDLFEMLTLALKKNGIIKDSEEFVRELLKREEQGSTAVGNGVALPHARLRNIDKIVICFIRLTEEIEFKAPDSRKVKLFFIIGTPQEKVADYLKLLARLSKLIKKRDLISALLQAENEQQVIQLIEEYEEKIS